MQMKDSHSRTLRAAISGGFDRLTEVGFIRASLEPDAPRRALDEEVPHQLAGRVSS